MTLAFLNIGTQEMILIVIVILLLFGGKKLPELARGLGRGIREFKDASEDIKREISDQINNFEKDLDVTVDEKPKSNYSAPVASATVASTIESADKEEVNNDTVEVPAEKKFPQFTAPEGTYQHDPGAHPIDPEEHYKYGYTDHFASNDESSEQNAENTSETNPTSTEENPTKEA